MSRKCGNCYYDMDLSIQTSTRPNTMSIINKKVSLPSSMRLVGKKMCLSDFPSETDSTGVGGPGDYTSSVQKINGKEYYGVDKKHGSYDRYIMRLKQNIIENSGVDC
jgi:hypothetical protein